MSGKLRSKNLRPKRVRVKYTMHPDVLPAAEAFEAFSKGRHILQINATQHKLAAVYEAVQDRGCPSSFNVALKRCPDLVTLGRKFHDR